MFFFVESENKSSMAFLGVRNAEIKVWLVYIKISPRGRRFETYVVFRVWRSPILHVSSLTIDFENIGLSLPESASKPSVGSQQTLILHCIVTKLH